MNQHHFILMFENYILFFSWVQIQTCMIPFGVHSHACEKTEHHKNIHQTRVTRLIFIPMMIQTDKIRINYKMIIMINVHFH